MKEYFGMNLIFMCVYCVAVWLKLRELLGLGGGMCSECYFSLFFYIFSSFRTDMT